MANKTKRQTKKQVDHFPSNTSLARQQYLIMFIVSVCSYPSVSVPSCPSLLADIYNCYSIAHMSPLWLLHSSSVLQILQASGGNNDFKTAITNHTIDCVHYCLIFWYNIQNTICGFYRKFWILPLDFIPAYFSFCVVCC